MNGATELVGPADVRELISARIGGMIPTDQVEQFMRVVRSSATLWVGTVDGEFVCVWGLAPPSMLSQRAYLWLHVTPALRGHEFIFIRRSQIAVQEMLQLYPEIVGHVERDNAKAKRWLRWLGAKITPARGRLDLFNIKAAR